ncbi:hypothetical protein EHQ53_11290 [Leptospira langatensis]|uniref:Lipoprotein n=1 Tax=Leptospira langatensis TaxID=2484983 RepID=A0A5F1ZS10_9LEPT|nr:hypothetical protein [Leptospira langatensis]TGJ98865.1 hypothetical protein EHO57_15210 [Leptospira langatensis]TGL40568.1 hypothetical protein EHQ53_11290 [Leptospira langatensis]
MRSGSFFRFPQILLILVGCLLVGCFEYEETLTINPNLSGTLEVSYVVPTKRKSDESLIKFLPTRKEEILNRLNKGFFFKSLVLKDYTFQKMEIPEAEPGAFREKAKVSYKLEFTDVSQLESILLGNVQIKKEKANTIYIKREFPSISKSLDSVQGDGEKKLLGETLRLIRGNSLLFKVNFPITSVCYTNRGEQSLGKLAYRLPLADTIEKFGNKSWDYRITFVY